MKRLRVILLFLLLGAILNVAVAWGIVWLGPHPSSHVMYGFTPGDEQYGAWHTSRFNSIGHECIHSKWNSPMFPNSPYSPPPSRSADSILPLWASYAYPDVVPQIAVMRFLDATGIPVLSFWSGREWLGFVMRDDPSGTSDDGDPYVEAPPTFSYGIVLPNQPIPSQRTFHKHRVLPFAPLWPGLVINTLFYAGLLWLLIPGPFVLRRIIRNKRGLCVKCAYDLRGAEHEACPECGTGVRKARPA